MRPVLGAETLHSDYTCRARRMNEFIHSRQNTDVGGPTARGPEEKQIAWCQVAIFDDTPRLVLVPRFPRQHDAVVREHIASEATAVEARWIGASVAVRHAT